MKYFYIALPIVSPIVISTLLIRNNFNPDTGSMLNLFLPLVWGILIALGGGIIYLNDHRAKGKGLFILFLNSIAERAKTLSLTLIAETLIFILFAILFPARGFIKSCFGISETTYDKIRLFSDSILFSTIVVPSIFAVFVGMTCLLISFNSEKSP